jgi:hypothetical protein
MGKEGAADPWGSRLVCAAIIAGLSLLAHQTYHRVEDTQQRLDGSAGPSVSGVTLEVSEDKQTEDIALFTHANKELHCMDRELKHPCVSELRSYLDDKTDEASTSRALTCVHHVLATSDDYWVLKNMTHLLLDLDTVDHVFDESNDANGFVLAGLDFAKKLIENDECLREFDTKSELECRCVPLYTKVAILKMKNINMLAEAKELFGKVTSMAWSGNTRSYGAGKAVRWDHYQQTPQIWVDGLRSVPVWERETWTSLPICDKLEENFATIKDETRQALDKSAESFENAYRFLYKQGEWTRLLLYNAREFTEECEVVFPKTCALLKQWLPSKPGLPWTSDQNEQVMIIKMKRGTSVETHSGPANNILNIHLGISGLEGAKLIVANETYSWEQGKVIPWDGSYDHSVDCRECREEERVIMMVRYMHPDMSREHYRGVQRTHFEEVPLELQ